MEKCPNCGKEVSAKASKCVHCGYNLNEKRCPDCGTPVINGTEICPNCGCPLDIKKKKPVYKKIWFWILMIVLVAALIFGVMMLKFMNATCFKEIKKYSKMDKSDFIKVCEEYDPETCRNDSKFMGKPIKLDLRISFREGNIYFANAKDKAEEQRQLNYQEEMYNQDLKMYQEELNLYEKHKDSGWVEPGDPPKKESLDDYLIWQGEEFALWNYGECKMLEDDIVTIYGVYAGESKVLTKVPYPVISVLYFEKMK